MKDSRLTWLSGTKERPFILRVLRTRYLPKNASGNRPKPYTQPQLLVCLLLKETFIPPVAQPRSHWNSTTD